MDILNLCLVIAILNLYHVQTSHQEQEHSQPHNLTNWAKSRQKRFLIYDTAGVCKYIISYAMPVDLHDKRTNWRALSSAWNLQWQHTLPTSVEYLWNNTYFKASPGASRSFASELLTQFEPSDLSATFLYAMMESYLNNKGMNGRQCLQRAICENAQVHYVGGVFDKIYKRLLTPERTMEQHYKDSYIMGSKGVDCYKAYTGCPKGESLFDKFVRIGSVK